MEGPSNTHPDGLVAGIQELYLHALHTNVSNFVSVKLSSNDDYDHWRTQMICLMETHDMSYLVDAAFDISSRTKIVKQYDTLLKGWIFGTVSQRVLGTVLGLSSAKGVWDQLKYFHAPNISFCAQQDSAPTKLEAKEQTKGKGISIETETKEDIKGKGISTEIETNLKDVVFEEKKTKEDQYSISVVKPSQPRETSYMWVPDIENTQKKFNEYLKEDVEEGRWRRIDLKLLQYSSMQVKFQAINNEKSTVLHLAVEKGHDCILENLLGYLKKEEDVKEALEMKNVHGSTALHVAATLGNKSAAEILVKRHKELLTILDNQDHDPLSKAYSNLQFDTCIYLLEEAFKTKMDNKLSGHVYKIGSDLVVNAISAKEYSRALDIVQRFPEFATESDQVLMAIARTFPSGLSHEEAILIPDLGDVGIFIIRCIARSLFDFVTYWWRQSHFLFGEVNVPRRLLFWVRLLIDFLISIFFLPFIMPYFVLWKGARALGSYMNRTKKKEWREAKKVLKLVCDQIDELKFSGAHHPFYKGPILEAACQNAYEVVDEILSRSPEVIKCQDECGYDIIQLAVIHRSDKIYNRVYQNEEGHNQYYKTIKDSCLNNMLHLAGRLAPSHKLNLITGAALQLQRELQWREELKKFVFPAYITQENIYKETPDVVFTREHEKLVKEGETWMKTTAESCSITAGLITTIVFAAAITVPGGSNQEKGTPLFSHEIAFIIFAISDAISLFTSTITLLVFLSILTARFSEQDFLVSLPRRLIIGLYALLVSTTAMMVAFGAILFLVFCHKNPWMLVPICTTVCLTIVLFFIIQFPLILDLYRSTYVPIFGTKSKSQ